MTMLIVAVIIPGVCYWVRSGAQPLLCIYGNPACSQVVATYILCALTLAAFLAAYKAATHAQETFEHERAAMLAVQRCICGDDVEGRRVEVYLRDPYVGFNESKPPGFDPSLYAKLEVELHSVGRSPVINGRIAIAVHGQRAHAESSEIEIGTILKDATIHLRLWIVSNLDGAELSWSGKGYHGHDDEIIVYVPANMRAPVRMDFDQTPAVHVVSSVMPPRKKTPSV
jgi:hypothetical protein